MATKTLTITEEAYTILAGRKLENESFSQEIKRLFSNKKARKLTDFFGIISEEEGESMLKDLEKFRAMNIELSRERIR